MYGATQLTYTKAGQETYAEHLHYQIIGLGLNN
jgi:hypothetical protein